ncbi:MAG TPA: HAMP domain-containing sensor histidine kinase [Chloroflexota bacterium]|nr:HAMP domain-containing sensor histidine kinase [Chloroflexota bacterium]
MRATTVRLRLTLWYTALLTVFVAGFAVLVYGAVDRQLAGDLDHAVELRAVEVAQAVATTTPGHARGAVEPLRVPTSSALADQPHYVQVVSRRGTVLLSSPTLAEPLPVSDEARQIMLDGQVTRDVLTLPGEERLALYGAPLMRDEMVVGVVLVAVPLWPIEQTLERLQLVLGSAVLGSVFLASGVGWLLASAAMRPVDRITALARSIGRSGDLSGRVPAPHGSDELGRLSVAFNELLERLDTAMAQQRRFLDDASHELRTPLTTIRASASALLRGGSLTPQPPPPAAGEGELRAIARESERMGRLVTDLLALARADAGQLLARRPMMLDALLVDVYQQARHQAPDVRLTIGDLEQVEILGDPDRLKQLLFNLVDNACRYTPAGGTVTLALSEQDGTASLSVRDTGPGIPSDELPRIFERFYRADHARSREVGGTGLGLAISQVIAEAHGGWIAVDSRVGEGSTFTVYLPTRTLMASAGRTSQSGVLTTL